MKNIRLSLRHQLFSFSNPTHLSPVFSAYLMCRILLCACAHGVKSEISFDTGCFLTAQRLRSESLQGFSNGAIGPPLGPRAEAFTR